VGFESAIVFAMDVSAIASNQLHDIIKYSVTVKIANLFGSKEVELMKIEELLQKKGIIHCDPEIMSGVPEFVGTRVP